MKTREEGCVTLPYDVENNDKTQNYCNWLARNLHLIKIIFYLFSKCLTLINSFGFWMKKKRIQSLERFVFK